MKRTHFKPRSKRNRIDLTNIGREELIIPAIARADELLIGEYEGEVIADTPLPDPLPPRPYVPEKVSWAEVILSAIKREVINVIKI